jgi:hypothetical protein
MYKCCRHRWLYSVRKIIVPIRSLSTDKIRETLYQILTYTRYIYIYVWIQKLIVNFLFLSLKKKSNDFTFALSCFEHSTLSLWSSYYVQADDALQILPSTYVHVQLHIYITNDQTVVTTWPSLVLFCLERGKKIRIDSQKKKKRIPLYHVVCTYFFLVSAE